MQSNWWNQFFHYNLIKLIAFYHFYYLTAGLLVETFTYIHNQNVKKGSFLTTIKLIDQTLAAHDVVWTLKRRQNVKTTSIQRHSDFVCRLRDSLLKFSFHKNEKAIGSKVENSEKKRINLEVKFVCILHSWTILWAIRSWTKKLPLF